MDIHPFYVAMRISNLSLDVILISLFAFQCYKDRHGLLTMKSLMELKTRRAFRVCGFLGCIGVLIYDLDVYGVYGIWSPAARISLNLVGMFFIWTPLCIACYHSIAATLTFLPFKRHKSTRIVKAVTIFIWSTEYFYMVVAFGITSRAVGLISLGITCLNFALIGVGVNAVFLYLLKQQRDMERMGDITAFYSESSRNLVREWRRYAVVLTLVTIALIITIGFSIVRNVQKSADEGVGSSFQEYDPSMLPDNRPAPYVMPWIVYTFFTIMLWRSWKSNEKSQTAAHASLTKTTKKAGGTGGMAASTADGTTAHATTGGGTTAPGHIPPSPSHQTTITITGGGGGNSRQSPAPPPVPPGNKDAASASLLASNSQELDTGGDGGDGDEDADDHYESSKWSSSARNDVNPRWPSIVTSPTSNLMTPPPPPSPYLAPPPTPESKQLTNV